MIKKTALRLLASLLTILMVLSSVAAMSVSAENTWITTEDGLVCVCNGITSAIMGYEGDASELVIPEEISGYPVTTIAQAAFMRCDTLTSITLPSTLMYINSQAFSECSALKSMSIPAAVISIGDSVFDGCESLTEIQVEADNEYYKSENGVLFTKRGLSLIAYPDSKASNSYTVPEGTEDIDGAAFSGAVYLEKITFPDSLKTIGDYAFAESALKECIFNEGLTEIGESAFTSTNLETVTLPDSITVINENVFSYCHNLKSAIIPKSVKVIGDGAFAYTGLESITFPAELEAIGDSAFENCSSLVIGEIPSTVKTIGDRAFYCCKLRSELVLPESLETMGEEAFYMCESLESVVFPEGLKSIEASAFESCDNLKSVEFSEGLESIGASVFMFCDNLKSVCFPRSLETIGDDAFSFGGLEGTVTIPENVSSIGLDVFHSYNISEFVVDDNNEYYTTLDGIMYTMDKSHLVAYPGGSTASHFVVPKAVTSIDADLFGTCRNLKSLTIHENVTFILETGLWTFDELTIYGYEGTQAEAFADSHFFFTFVPLYKSVDSDTGLTVYFDTTDTYDLSVEEITSEETINAVNTIIIDGELVKLYDITLMKNGAVVQPDGTVTVKIPADNENSIVYRVEEDGTLTYMNAYYSDGYMVFTTEHFSLYVLVNPTEKTIPTESTDSTEHLPTQPNTTEPQPTTTLGDKLLLGDADLSGKVNVKDATTIQKTVAGLTELSDYAYVAANVVNTDVLNVKDATAIQKWVAGMTVSVSINEYVAYPGDDTTTETTTVSEDITMEPEETTVVTEPDVSTVPSEDVAVISCGGKTYTVAVGDTVTYTASLCADKVFESIDASVKFNSNILKNNLLASYCPNLVYSVINCLSTGELCFNAADGMDGYDFSDTEVLVVAEFTVVNPGETEIYCSFKDMVVYGGEEFYYSDGNECLTEGISVTEEIVVN